MTHAENISSINLYTDMRAAYEQRSFLDKTCVLLAIPNGKRISLCAACDGREIVKVNLMVQLCSGRNPPGDGEGSD